MEGLKRTEITPIGGFNVRFNPDMWYSNYEHTKLDGSLLTFGGKEGFFFKFAPMCGFWLEHRFNEWLMYKTVKAQWKR